MKSRVLAVTAQEIYRKINKKKFDLISSEDCIKWCSADVKTEAHQALVLLPSCFPERVGVKQKWYSRKK